MATHGAAAEVVGRCDDRLGVAQGDGMEKANKCDHFTIRGYVADVRKQDAKACWPLSIPHGQTIEVLVNSLPPLIVPEFRRWRCRNCRHSIITSGDAKGSAPVMTKNEEASVKDFTLVLKDGTDNLLSNIEQPSRVGSSGIEVAEVGTSSINVNVNVECAEVRPMLCHDSKELQNFTKQSIETHVSKFIHCGSEEIQHQPSNSTVVAAEHKSVEAEEDVREDITVYASNLNISPHDNSSNNLVCDERNDIDLNRTYECDDIFDGTLPDNRIDIVESSHGDDRISVGVKTKLCSGNVAKKNVVVLNGSCTLKDVTLSISESPSTIQELANSDQTENKISCSVVLRDYVDDKNYGREAGHSNGEFNYKKARKTRLRSLEDIMRKDASCAPKDLCFSKGDAALSKTKNVRIGPCRLNSETKHSSKNQLIRQICESVKTVKCLVGSQAGDKYDEETSLNHWLMRVSKKSVADKGSSLTTHTEDRACNSVGTSGKKGVHHQEKISSKILQQAFVKEKENKRPRIQSGNPCRKSQQEKMRTGDELINLVPPKNIQTKRKNGISKKTLHIDHRKIDNSCDVMCDSYNNPKKVLQVGDVSPSKKRPKKEVKRKRRMINKSGEKNLDDIPMDVVEILAKIQHEKHLSDAKFSTDNNYSVPASNDSCIARCCESNSWNTMYTNPDTSNDMRHAIHIRDKDCQCRQEYDYSKNQKCHIHIDLNQQASDSHLAMSDCIGYNSFGAAPPFAYSKEIHSCQYLPWDKIKMQPFGFCYKDRLSLAQGSIRTVPDRLPLQANDRIFGVSMRMSSLEQNCVNIDSHNGYLNGELVTAVKKSEEVRKPSDPYVLNAGWKTEQSTNKVHLPLDTCLMQGQNGCRFGAMELSGSCNKDTVSATNLLRFVNQAAFSGASLDRNSVSNYGAYCSSPCSVIHGSEVGMTNKEMLNGPFGAAYYSQGQNSRSIPQLHRPVARIGVFNPSLQDEIMTHSNMYGTTLDSEFRWTDELPHLQMRGEKAEYFCSPADFECRNMDHTIFMRKNMPTMSAGSSLVQGCSSSRHGMDQAVVADKGKAQHPSNICTTGYCIVNQNPADFTLPDDDNEYMREVKI